MITTLIILGVIALIMSMWLCSGGPTEMLTIFENVSVILQGALIFFVILCIIVLPIRWLVLAIF